MWIFSVLHYFRIPSVDAPYSVSFADLPPQVKLTRHIHINDGRGHHKELMDVVAQ